jgi:site-specific DNA-cytosine methylase
MVMLENVVGLVYKKGTKAENGVVKDLAISLVQNNIRQVVAKLESLEYSVATTIIDPSLYGIPQHRLRVWILAIRTPGSPVTDFGHAVAQAIDHMKVQPLPLANFLLLEGSEDRHFWAEKEDRRGANFGRMSSVDGFKLRVCPDTHAASSFVLSAGARPAGPA